MSALHEDLCTFMIITHSDLLTVRNGSDKSRRENQNTHFMSINFLSENETFYVIKWKYVVEQDSSQMTT
jgi:hypothetical protein